MGYFNIEIVPEVINDRGFSRLMKYLKTEYSEVKFSRDYTAIINEGGRKPKRVIIGINTKSGKVEILEIDELTNIAE